MNETLSIVDRDLHHLDDETRTTPARVAPKSPRGPKGRRWPFLRYWLGTWHRGGWLWIWIPVVTALGVLLGILLSDPGGPAQVITRLVSGGPQ